MSPSSPRVVVAFVWDFDRTLIVGDQQEAIFAEYGVDGAAFWAEVDALPAFHRERGEIISPESAYLLHLLAYVEAGLLPGLDNARLRELGSRLQPSPGIPAFLEETRRHVATDPRLAARGIVVEHYVVSAGLRPMIEGSPIGPCLDGIWASTFVEHAAPPGYLSGGLPARRPGCLLRQGLVIDDTAKTRAVFEINKGINRDPEADVHARMAQEQRRVPFSRMLYVADGHSDIPVFALLNERGGHTLGVYQSAAPADLARAAALREEGRVEAVAEADFRPGRPAHRWLTERLDRVADEVPRAL